MRTTNSLMQLAHDTADWQAMTSSILFSLSQALAQAPPDLDEIALIIARQFADVWGFPEVSIALYNPQNNTFRYLIDYYDTENVDPSIEDWTGKVVSMSDSPATAQVMETLEPLIVHASNPSTNPAQAKLMEEYDVKTAAFFPLSVKGRFIGRIELETWGEEYPFTPQEINLAIAMASQAAVALENAQLYKTAKYEISERAQAKKALQESQALYHSLVENLPQNIFRKDIDGHITFVNQHYCTTLGKTLEEILGKTDFELYPPELAEKYRKEDLRVIKTQQVFETVSETKLPDKTTTYAQVIKSPLYDSEGNVSGIQGVFWDVTEQIRIDTSRRTAEQRYRSLFQQAHDAVFIADLNGNHKEVNQRAAEMLGYTIEELKQLSFIDVSVETDDSKQVIENLLAGQHLPQYERLFRKKDGAIIPVEITVELVRDADGKPLHIQSVVRDITERKQSELEREALVNALEHRSMLLETAASVSKSVTAILSPDKLLQETVDLIQSRFNYYYVGIFLVNEEKDFAILKAGTGKAGKQMLASEHKLAVGGESMIGWSVAHAKAKIAHDVGEEAVHFENPHLPETRSEMALPLVIHGEAIGAFTVQSIKETAFSEEDITVLQAMADQLAIAIQNPLQRGGRSTTRESLPPLGSRNGAGYPIHANKRSSI
ncbi:MAG: hypothetical protein B6243_04245 [Anaerolineaceae bacterium 4572_5.2]|nr:MAG: hypothetical protein B6243_04245 [Anaerolineaceae bacterium 4572_5.2]